MDENGRNTANHKTDLQGQKNPRNEQKTNTLRMERAERNVDYAFNIVSKKCTNIIYKLY